MVDDAYGPGRGSNVAAKRTNDDHSNAPRASAPSSGVRNKSSVPKRVTAEPDANPFSTNNNVANMKMLGFENDFLNFTPGHDPRIDRTPTREELRVAESNPYENLDDIDFRTNMGGGANPFLNVNAEPPSFGRFDKAPPKAQNSGHGKQEPNLLDL